MAKRLNDDIEIISYDDNSFDFNNGDDNRKRSRRKKALIWSLAVGAPLVASAVALPLALRASGDGKAQMPQDDDILHRIGLDARSGLKLNETNFTTAQKSDFVLSGSSAPVVITAVASTITVAPHVDGFITYNVTLQLRASHLVRTVKVPYEALINKLTLGSTQPNVNFLNWNNLNVSDFHFNNAPGSTLATIESVTKPSVQPAPNTLATYVVHIKLGPLTRDITVNLPFINLQIAATTYRTVSAIDWDQLTTTDFMLTTTPTTPGFSIKTVHPTSPQPTSATGIVTYAVTYEYQGITGQVSVNVPYDNSSDHNNLVNATVTYSGATRNETNFDQALASDFTVGNNHGLPITVTAVQSQQTTAPTSDGFVTYAVTLSLNSSTDTRLVQVPYATLINNASVTANLSKVTSMDWNLVQATDFTVNNVPGATVVAVSAPLQQPTGADATYTVTIKSGNLTRDIVVTIPYVQLTVNASTSKTADSTTWNQLTVADFVLNVIPSTPGFQITSVQAPSSKPTTTKGYVDYVITYAYKGVSRTTIANVPYDDSHNVLVAASVTYVGPTLNETSFDQAQANNFLVSSADPATTITHVSTPTSAPNSDGTVDYDITLNLNGKPAIKTVQVPYVTTINQLGVDALITGVNQFNWGKLMASDFMITYPQGQSSTATIESVTAPATAPTVTGEQASYVVRIKNGSLTRDITVKIPYTHLVIDVSTTKVVNSQDWDQLSESDFTINTYPDVDGFAIDNVVTHSTKPTTDTGTVVYEVEYSYLGNVVGGHQFRC